MGEDNNEGILLDQRPSIAQCELRSDSITGFEIFQSLWVFGR